MSREEAGTGNANRRAQPCQPPHKSAGKQTKRERSDSPAVALICVEPRRYANPVGAVVRRSNLSREEAGTANANRRAQPCQPHHKSARKQTKRERSDSPAVAVAVDLDLALALDLPATSGGRAQVLRREVEAMDGRKALRPRRGRTARSSRSKTGAREPRSAAEGPDAGASGFWLLFSKKTSDPP
ncbi:hypothetical protein J3B00_004162 [Pseudomonas sp. BP8]|nr:hypothetical protein [Pseudomonas sp. BP8]